MTPVFIGIKMRRIDGKAYYVDNFYLKESSAQQRKKKLQKEGFLVKIIKRKPDKKGRVFHEVLKRHKKHPHLRGLIG